MAKVKICGITDPQNLHASIKAGARFVGFVFYPPSPRAVTLDIAASLARMLPTGVRSVGLFVDPDDALLERVINNVPLDMIQLHGKEPPSRVAEIKARYPLELMKAIPVAESADLRPLKSYEATADWILFDAKSAKNDLPGGMGQTFDWKILSGQSFSKPWMLSGGLTIKNVADAIRQLKPDAIDVSSGVERSRGIKDPEKIKAFIQAAKGS